MLALMMLVYVILSSRIQSYKEMQIICFRFDDDRVIAILHFEYKSVDGGALV